jgi:hypothetical protein
MENGLRQKKPRVAKTENENSDTEHKVSAYYDPCFILLFLVY